VTLAKAVLGLYLVVQYVAGLIRVSRGADTSDAEEMSQVGIAATLYSVVMGGLFVALVNA
jgi:hypothetical protein